MTKILEIYKTYNLIEFLQEHQFRVAAVGKLICDNLTSPVDELTVVQALLLHDMANIIKFDLNYFPKALEPQGLEYWQAVQAEFVKKYGKDEHQATLKIAKELKAAPKVIECIDNVGFTKINGNYFTGTLEQKICNYADMRVAPTGVVLIAGRMADGHKRYDHRRRYSLDPKDRQVIVDHLYLLEAELFKDSKIKPADITDQTIEPIVAQLKSYEI